MTGGRGSRATGWQVGLGGMAIVAVSFGFARYGYGLFVPVFRDEFALSTAALGLVSSGAYATYLAALLLAGVLSSRVGPRAPVVLAGLSATAGMLLIAVAPSAAVLATGVLLASTSAGWAWAPYSDAVDRLVRPEARDRTLSLVSTGTSLGLVVAGPLALVAGTAWRVAWLLFAVLALASAVGNARLLPGRPSRGRPGPPDGGRREPGDGGPPARTGSTTPFLGRHAVPLFSVAFVFGFSGAFYWTYAADLTAAAGLPPAARLVLWTLVGATGVAGLVTGDLVGRLGLRPVLAGALTVLAAGIALLGLAPGSWAAVAGSAALYGPGFMTMSALLAVWSSAVFPDRPSAGFTATLLLLAAGSVAGPATLGVLAGALDLPALFLVAAALTLLGLLAAAPRGGAREATGPSRALARP